MLRAQGGYLRESLLSSQPGGILILLFCLVEKPELSSWLYSGFVSSSLHVLIVQWQEKEVYL